MGCSVASNSPHSRERELYRYYQPESTTPVDPKDPASRKSSNDPILTAFAQLGALRLKLKRGIITLSTSCREWIIAESGQSLSLQQDDDEHDQLWHGIGMMACGAGAGPDMITYFGTSGENIRVVSDAREDEFMKDKDIVLNEPHIRFMACVPLRTPGGVVIGAYVVVDDQVRDGLEDGEKQFMMDMGITVMDYLQSGLVKRKQHRADTMVKAMGLFIEGKSSLREWWLEYGHKGSHGMQKRTTKSASIAERADEEFGVQDPTDLMLKTGLNGLPGHSARPTFSRAPSSESPSIADLGDGRPSLPRGQSSATDSSLPVGGAMSMVWGHDRHSSVTTADSGTDEPPPMKNNSVSFDLPPEEVSVNEVSKDLQDAVLTGDLRGVFARASNLIREAIGVEGVMYYDASVGSFGGSSERSVMDEKAPGAFKVEGAAPEGENYNRKMSVVSLGGAISDNAPQSASEAETAPEKCCNILGFSTRRRSTLRDHPTIEEHRHFPESSLRRLLKRYPHGKVFNFDEDGQIASDSDPTSSGVDTAEGTSTKPTPVELRARQKRQSREAEAKAILKIFPGARSVFWFPLWDSSRDRWYAGSFVWSTSATRILCPVEDLTYLASFSNSVMAEVARISAQVLAQMKTDFISSISHELRSPLHGVLASVEFLQETEMDEMQTDMVNNIHASGKVLLDTINHVLDFSKVNRKSRSKGRFIKKGKRSRKVRERANSDDNSTDDRPNVCVLSEEVIDSIYAGHRVKKHAFGSNTDRHLSMVSMDAPVSIIVDIAWRANWLFDIDTGAWRRILMNLFSNAMKYTKAGFVKITLDVEEDIASRGKQQRSNLILKVSDSGKGISQEFLKHQLFKPFKQEDSLASGAGLGLSIIRHIIQDLGGHIEFTSEQGSGTEATVRLPLPAQSPAPVNTAPDVIDEVRDLTLGFKFGLEGFERYPDITEEPTGILSSDVQAAMFLKATTISVLTNWFKMEASATNSPFGSSNTNLVMIMEAGLGKKTINEVLEPYCQNRELGSKKPIAVVLCNNYHPTFKIENHNVFDIVHMQQPYGPHKLAKLLQKVLLQKENGIVRSAKENGFTSPLYTPTSPGATSRSEESLTPTITLSPTSTAQVDPLSQSQNLNSPGIWSQESANQSFGLWRQTPPETPTPAPPVAASAPPVTAPVQETCKQTARDEGLRVLLVEDNEINLKLLVAYMRKLKLDHATATNGLEALDTYKDQEGRYDVIFMDISMPVMDGIESSRNIRRFEREMSLPPVALIALTGAANPNTRQEAFSSGVDLFLTKPVPMKALKVMLEDLRKNGRDGLSNDSYEGA